MSRAALTLSHVTKHYGWQRKLKALDDLSFSVPEGSVCGLIGPNGAGKTTAFSVISGFLTQDSGEVDILGLGPFEPERLKGKLGVLPQDADLGDRHTPRELLTHLARLQGMTPGDALRAAQGELEALDLGPRADWKIQSLSHGMRRRVAVASALIGRPELVLLDEPTAGLDPRQVIGLRQHLGALRGRVTLVVSSHILAELEALCDYVVFMDQGRCVRHGPMHEVTGRGEVVLWTLSAPLGDLRPLEQRLPGHSFEWRSGVLVQRAPAGADLDACALAIMGHLCEQGLAIREMRRGVSLEESFLAGGG